MIVAVVDEQLAMAREVLEGRTTDPLRDFRKAGIRSVRMVSDSEEVVRLISRPEFAAIDQDGKHVLVVEMEVEV